MKIMVTRTVIPTMRPTKHRTGTLITNDASGGCRKVSDNSKLSEESCTTSTLRIMAIRSTLAVVGIPVTFGHFIPGI